MVAAAVMFSLMGVFTKAATRADHALPGGEIAFFRYGFGLLFLLSVKGAIGADLLGNDRRGLLVRGVIGGVASVLFFLGVERTTLTHATLLNYTSVVWAPLLAVVSLHEPLGRRGLLAVVAATAGVLLVTRPTLGTLNVGDLIALASGVLAGGAIVQIRRLRRGETSLAVFFYFNLLGLPLSLLALGATGTPFQVPTPAQWPLLGLIGASSVSAQLLMTYGYRELTAGQGSLITLTSVVFTALLAHGLFGEALPLATLAGGALILASAAALALTSRRP